MADFWDQFPLADQQQGAGGISAPTSPIANTGINGGNMGGTVQPAPNDGSSVGGWQNGQYYDFGMQSPITGMPMPSPTPAGGYPSVPQTGAFGSGVNTGASGQVQPSGGGVTMQQFNDAWLASPYPGTVEGLKQFYASDPKWAAGGVTLGGSKGDKVYGPGGSYWGDAVIAAGAGGQGKSGLSGDTGGGGAGGAGSGLAGLGYGFGSSMAPWTEQFGAPDPNTIANDPYYKFQMSEGMNALQNSAAARGTLLSGGFAKQAEQYGQGLASSFGDKAYDRGMNEYLLRRDNAFQNQDRPFNKNLDLAKLGRPV